MPDDDAPDCPESTRYWANVRISHKETDKSTSELSSRINIGASPSMADALLASPSGSLGSMASKAEVASAGRNAEAALAVFQGLKNSGAASNSAEVTCFSGRYISMR